MPRSLGFVFAGLLLAASPTHAADTVACVHDVAGLRDALGAAVGSTGATYIELVRGSYPLNDGTPLSFYSTANNQGQLDITGGYDADCSGVIKDPSLTVISGQEWTSVLQLSSYAGVSVRYLTIENGFSFGINSGLSVYSTNGGIIVDYNIIRTNTASKWSGLSAEIGDGSGDMHVDGNLIVSNSSSDGLLAAGEVTMDGGATGVIYVTNNTIADNLDPGDTAYCGGLEVNSGVGGAHVSNNIFWHNTNYGLYVSDAVLTNNDLGTSAQGFIEASSSGNVAVAPHFVDTDDYRLAADSALLGAGALAPAGGLPTIDIQGHPRSFDGAVDIGAYEFGNEIFGYDFER